MLKRLLAIAFVLAAFTGTSYADTRSDARSQVAFGITVAQQGLLR